MLASLGAIVTSGEGLPAGTIAYLKFDDNSNKLKDETGLNTITFSGSNGFDLQRMPEAKFGKAIWLNTSSSGSVTGKFLFTAGALRNGLLGLTTEDFTIEFFYYPYGTADLHALFMHQHRQDNSYSEGINIMMRGEVNPYIEFVFPAYTPGVGYSQVFLRGNYQDSDLVRNEPNFIRIYRKNNRIGMITHNSQKGLKKYTEALPSVSTILYQVGGASGIETFCGGLPKGEYSTAGTNGYMDNFLFRLGFGDDSTTIPTVPY